MKRLEALGVLGLLALTGWSLVATPRTCSTTAFDFTWTAEGGCGPTGPLRIFRETNVCEATVEGAQALHLPAHYTGTDNVDLNSGGWSLTGGIEAGDGGATASSSGSGLDERIFRECAATRVDGVLRLDCEDTLNGPDGGTPPRCSAILTPL